MTPYYNVLNAFAHYNKSLNKQHTEQYHGIYEFFTKKMFKGNLYNTHKMSKHLSASPNYIPDFKVSYQLKKKTAVGIFIIEIKKGVKVFSSDKSDLVKLHLEM